MTKLEKREDMKRLLVTQLSRKVRSHRPAAKVLEMAIAFAEERLEQMDDHRVELEWQLEYLGTLDPKEIEPGQKES